jgi:Bacterial TSP3 repeat
MKTFLVLTLLISSVAAGDAGTTINATNKFAYGADIGWIDWRGDTNNGAVIGEYVCSGYLYAANVGWIHLGSNAPANGIRYQNNSATDYGVNHDGQGNLNGYAYGANIGWIHFTNGTASGLLPLADQPRVDLYTGKLSGYAYSANCGWISLSNAFAHVQTDAIPKGADSDGDGITDAWELTYTNTLTAFGNSTDADGDGVSDKNEYLADTNPIDPSDYLRIIQTTRGLFGPTYVTLRWTSKPTRFYAVQNRPALQSGSWADYTVFPFAGANNAGFDEPASIQFYRIRAFNPLTP